MPRTVLFFKPLPPFHWLVWLYRAPIHRNKRLFSILFLILVFLLLFLPFVSTVNELLTRLLLKFGWYRAIEQIVVPVEIRSVITVLRLVGIRATGSSSALSIVKDGYLQKIVMSWNCIGWQSMILIVFTLITGLQGKYYILAKIETILIGILGTLVVNLIRISSVVVIFKYFGYLPAILFHDYAANIAIILWLFFFWWFSYRFVLEEK